MSVYLKQSTGNHQLQRHTTATGTVGLETHVPFNSQFMHPHVLQLHQILIPLL